MLAKLSSRTRLALPLLGLALLSGCPDPSGKFDEFGNRVIDSGMPQPADSGPDATPLDMIPDISGEFLMGMAVVLSPSTPLWFRVTHVMTDNGDGTATVDVTIQPLDYDHPMHIAVGDPLIANDVAINGAGQFTVVLTDAEIPGEANPITGNDLVGDFNIIGTIKSTDRVCGDVTGMVTSPAKIDVTGTTFSSIRITGADLPALESACPVETTPDAGTGTADAAP
jgi:hypothetical protein